MAQARVLIVDDERDIREVLKLALRIDGCETDVAVDGVEALEKFGDGTTWDVVLLDQAMPRLEGLEVLREMKRRDPAARVIMVTAFATVELAEEAMAAGAVDFVKKPFSGEALRGAVRAAMTRPKSDHQPQEDRSLNGFRVHFVPSVDGKVATADFHIWRSFEVEEPRGGKFACDVELTRTVQELLKQTTGKHYPPSDSIWTALAESSLANFLWQEGEVPPETLVVKDLTTEQLHNAALHTTSV